MEGLTDQRSTSLGCIFYALFGDRPHLAIFFRICPYAILCPYSGEIDVEPLTDYEGKYKNCIIRMPYAQVCVIPFRNHDDLCLGRAGKYAYREKHSSVQGDRLS